MEEEKDKEVVTPEVEETQTEDGLADVIKKQKEMLKNSVTKEEYEKLSKENATLKDIVINGGALPGENEEEEKIDIEELTKHIFNPENQDDNLTYVTNALKLRKARLKEDGVDIFAPKIGSTNSQNITEEDFAAAEKVAEALQACVDEAGGDPGVFTAKLQSIIVDDSPTRKALYKRR